MKLIQADRDILLKPLQIVTGIVERRHTLPILSNVLIERKDEKISFVATDLEIQITTTAQDGTTVSEGYAVTVAAKKLQDILRALPDKTQVTLESEESRLHAKAGKSRFHLQTLPVEDFPKFPAGSEPQEKITLKQKELKHLLSRVQYAMAQQDIRYYLNGLLLLTEDNQLKVVATDGHRLAFALMALEPSGDRSEARREVILPRKVVLELTRLLGDTDDPVTVEILQNQVRFSFASVVLVTKVVDGKFPDYNRVIPDGYQKQFDITRQLLLQTLQRASILSNEKFRGVRLILTKDNLRIVCNNSEQEEAEEELEIVYGGDALDIGFNISYLLDVLNNLDGETVQLAFGDANSSALVTIPGDDSFQYVVMPMRI